MTFEALHFSRICSYQQNMPIIEKGQANPLFGRSGDLHYRRRSARAWTIESLQPACSPKWRGMGIERGYQIPDAKAGLACGAARRREASLLVCPRAV